MFLLISSLLSLANVTVNQLAFLVRAVNSPVDTYLQLGSV